MAHAAYDEDKDPKPVLPEYTEFPVLVEMEFNDRMEEYEEIAATIKSLEDRKKEVSKDIEASLMVANLTKVGWNKLPVSIRNGKTAAKIEANKLAELGVSPDVIKAATKAGTSYTYIYVQRPKTTTEGEKGGPDPYAE